MSRTATVERTTSESSVKVEVHLDGTAEIVDLPEEGEEIGDEVEGHDEIPDRRQHQAERR